MSTASGNAPISMPTKVSTPPPTPVLHSNKGVSSSTLNPVGSQTSNSCSLSSSLPDPQTQMINPKCWSGVDGFSCPEIWDDFDNPQICNVTLI